MLKRTMKYIFKNDYEICSEYAGYEWIGGSPITLLNDNISGTGGANVDGIAYHSYTVDDQVNNGVATVFHPTAIFKCYKGTEEGNSFQELPDATPPWHTANNYTINTVLTPTTQVVSGTTYVVWMPATTAGIYFAKVLQLSGGPGGTNITWMKILLQTVRLVI